jgi:hypothetical protein
VIQQRCVIPMACSRCKHAWNYSGRNRYYATCPHCRIYLKIEKQATTLSATIEKEKPTTKTGPTSPSPNQSDVVGNESSSQGSGPLSG